MTDANLAIRARGLSKVYRIYQNPFGALLDVLGRGKHYTEQVALDNVDLELHRGEIVGVLGRNGAGKSTLLKIVAGTLDRTAGDLEVSGRITAILELGTGFHPDYSGRDNIYMGGLCLGMTRPEIDAKLDAVIDFSELREVIDRPFKTYSTGMQARLTFATAISVDPDILIVDEALSVGDARFQMKCFSWIERLRSGGSTVLLVSHDTNTITTFCDHALILERGKVFAEGRAKEIVNIYQNLLFGRRPGNGTGELISPDPRTPVRESLPQPPEFVQSVIGSSGTNGSGRYGSGELELLDWGLFDERGEKTALVPTGSKCRLAMTLACKSEIPDLSAGFAIKDRRGTVVWGVTNFTQFGRASHVEPGQLLTIEMPCTMWLAAGDYFVTLGAAHLDDGTKIDFVEDGIGFRVTGPGNLFTTSVVNLDGAMTVAVVDG